jgi:peroxiredoxin
MALWNRKRLIEVGEDAPDFELQDAAGASYSCAALRVKAPVLFAFFKVSCPVCQLTFPFLDRLHRAVANERLRVIGISQDDAAATREFAERFGIAFPLLLDTAKGGYAVSNAFGISNVPVLFLVGVDGRIAWASMGFSKSDLEGLAQQFDVEMFRQDENVPAWKAG